MRAYLLAALLLLMLICTCRGGDENPPNENLAEDEYLDDSDLPEKLDVDGKKMVKKFPKKCRHLLKKMKGNKHHSQYELNVCLNRTELFEGDVRLADWQKPIIDNLIAESEANEHHIVKRGASKNLKRWDFARDSAGNKILPYEIDGNMNKKAITAISNTIKQFNDNTCIRMKERTDEHTWIRFFRGGGCWSYVGRVFKGAQQISIGSGCEYEDTVIHETLHALGFWHEQSRPDRDNYVTIKFANIQSGNANNFEKYEHDEWDSFGSLYDTKSLMHYDAYAFSKNGKPTIIDKNTGKAIVTASDFTESDIFQVNKMYECNVEEKNCTVLPTISGNGAIKGTTLDVYSTGQEVTLGCDEGYYPQDNVDVSTCENGAFTPPTLTCVKLKDCTVLPTISGNGAIKGTTLDVYSTGQEVTLGCDEGYSPQDNVDVSTCENGAFTPPTLTCVKDCTVLPTIIGNGAIKGTTKNVYTTGQEVTLGCDVGYSPQDNVDVSTCENGAFTPPTLTCVKKCEDKKKSCERRAFMLHCTKKRKKKFMSKNCQKSCYICGECEDRDIKELCDFYESNGYCDMASLKSEMHYSCAKTCQMC